VPAGGFPFGDRKVWRAAALFGAQNLAFFTMLAWLPFLLIHSTSSELARTLLITNSVIVPPALLLSIVKTRLTISRQIFVVGGLLCLPGALALSLGVLPLAWLWGAMVGLGTGLVAIGCLALPPTETASQEAAASYSAVMLAAGYIVSFAGPFLGGLLFAWTGRAAAGFWPILPAIATILVLGSHF
jgi:CP family cyanate transporter-like MFS transporter